MTASKRCQSEDVIILAEGGIRTMLRSSTLSDPMIGIWWADRNRIVAILQRPNNASGRPSLLDSDFSHADEWPSIAHNFNKTAEVEYFVVPRGRVIFDLDQGIGILYHGNYTEGKRLQEVATLFGFAVWKAQLDDHYLMGDSINDLFSQE